MNKKLCVLTALLLVFGAAGAFSIGIGVQGGYDSTIPGNFAITIKPDSLLTFAGNYYAGSDHLALGVSLDYWLDNWQITGPLYWFVGLGIGGLFDFGDELGVQLAGRIPIGLNSFFLNRRIELYAQFVPRIGAQFVPAISFVPFGFEGAAGVRFWFGY
jgi:hypothetical protein